MIAIFPFNSVRALIDMRLLLLMMNAEVFALCNAPDAERWNIRSAT
jgi:hypothetical protein